MYVGGITRITNTTASTSTTTGALIVSGGAGFAGRATATNMTCSTAPAVATDVVRKQEHDAVITAQTLSSETYTSVSCVGPWTTPTYTTGYRIFCLLNTVTLIFTPNIATSTETDIEGKITVSQNIPVAMRPGTNIYSVFPGYLVVNGTKEDVSIMVSSSGGITFGRGNSYASFPIHTTISMSYSITIMWSI
jgi:hypothetical protein